VARPMIPAPTIPRLLGPTDLYLELSLREPSGTARSLGRGSELAGEGSRSEREWLLLSLGIAGRLMLSSPFESRGADPL
jgi:hypothetical protein